MQCDGQRPVRVIVQDQRRLVREGLAAILSAATDIEVLASVETVPESAAWIADADAVICAEPFPSDLLVRSIRSRDHAPSVLIAALLAPSPLAETYPHLTGRESEIIQGIAAGMSTRHIGTLLGISPKTVENHKQRIFVKLEVQSQAHAVAVAHAAGLLGRDERSA